MKNAYGQTVIDISTIDAFLAFVNSLPPSDVSFL